MWGKINMKNYSYSLLYFILIVSMGIVAGCALGTLETVGTCKTMMLLPSAHSRFPAFIDNDYSSLSKALAESLAFLRSQPQGAMVSSCGRSYTVAQQLETLNAFQELLQSTDSRSLDEKIRDSFTICQVLNSQGASDLLATGYYQPRVKASLTFKPPFIYPLYKRPADLMQFKESNAGKGTNMVGRLDNARQVPYWTRQQIESQGMLKGQELLYLADPVDAFVLHVQGSGLVELEDGSVYQVLFDGSNGRPYRSIGRLLVDEGLMRLAEVSLPKIRTYLQEHLDDRQRILHYNERYIFFRMAKLENQTGPIGSMGASLTPERSIALDNDCFSIGGLYFMETMKPQLADNQEVLGWVPFSHFVLHQDTGAAIEGSGRLDFFWGSGDYAQAAAGVMKQPARLYMIVGKE